MWPSLALLAEAAAVCPGSDPPERVGAPVELRGEPRALRVLVPSAESG